MKAFVATLLFFSTCLLAQELCAQPDFEPNYDESKIPDYSLPELLVTEDGQAVKNEQRWWEQRRPEILRLFETQVYGKTPTQKPELSFKVVSVDEKALEGKATRKQIQVFFTEDEARPYLDLLLYVPNKVNGPAPAFIGLNFFGNHTIQPDPEIIITDQWSPNNDDFGITDNKATDASRGVRIHRWPVEMIIDRGYALATIYCGDIDPDRENFQDGVHPLFYKAGQQAPADDEWGTVGAWAWGLSRGLDYLETDEDIASDQVAVIGHSRLGKASVWAGAQDQRFAMVISNDSGCGGVALSRRAYGETVGRINHAFPHWFCGNFKQYSQNEAALPVDQHMLLALVAPRPLYVASAEGDQWADPKGEFLSAVYATPVYQLLGTTGLPVTDMPEVNQPVSETIGYHMRTGKHDITEYDWQQYLDFADKHFSTRTP
uniref:Acetylxylan esterase n=1 Tax=Roseihalotalea indica TaxID=2867963 RepID=A0AA49GRG1_9BACT|nr:acetylxylan esterase [Tunicatimonas sp. TK19036]